MKLYKELTLKNAEKLCKDWVTPGKDVYYDYFDCVNTSMQMGELRDAIMDYLSPSSPHLNLLHVTSKGGVYGVSTTTYPILTGQK